MSFDSIEVEIIFNLLSLTSISFFSFSITCVGEENAWLGFTLISALGYSPISILTLLEVFNWCFMS